MTVLAHAGTSLLSFGTDWLYVLVPLGLYGAGALWMWRRGATDEGRPIRRPVARIGSSLEDVTGLPGWVAAGLATGLMALVIAVLGFLWDVSWHIDLGRDEFLFTPAHTAILVGLAMIAAAGVVAIAFATVEDADVGFRVGPLRVPFSGAALAVLGGGSLLGFPIDELWHSAYGIDVTMWGPTHLVMIGGASLAPIALWLMVTEAGPGAGRAGYVRRARLLLAGGVLTGLSTFQAEFDFGAPQFQQLYHPVLVSIAAGIALVAARSAVGRGGALVAVAVFAAIRSVLAWIVGPVFDLT
ncbi:MAG TPA: hypothetical protein VG709_05465, partial [Actinomycetota bacterium]|nr:hypothetical protein [Actinomycetota bacterium]